MPPPTDGINRVCWSFSAQTVRTSRRAGGSCWMEQNPREKHILGLATCLHVLMSEESSSFCYGLYVYVR